MGIKLFWHFLQNDIKEAALHLQDNAADENLIGLIKRAKIDAKNYQLFCKKLEHLIHEFDQANTAQGKVYTLNVSMYPYQPKNTALGKIEIRKKTKEIS